MATPSRDVRWSERKYRDEGWRKLGVRVTDWTRQQLADLSEALGVSQGQVLSDLIAAEYERQRGHK